MNKRPLEASGWLSLIPFATARLDEHGLAPVPTALYGLGLLLCAGSWRLMQAAIIRAQGSASPVRAAIRHDTKARVSTVLYLLAIAFAFVVPIVSDLLYAGVAAWWLIPDRRVEAHLGAEEIFG